ncbi:hypothetical protein FFLO_03852 [Filobasidium floriforme]|uniref:Uncharacterized protein n=1 Tax=Filobasidium floriforme TaxID=5210 RepID=A0A8K0JLD5_9TREE|nr:uncharacterized protein HD553DRAFT_337684 [Filobasidium floriforme]KAG7532110.1 hypothetical protein FFLO_03852 [Filobasidium floriforme]KAH8078380.1 hypothetical protein HD553DRAFT_337684 [Filobasidium floriforme]
MLGLAAPTPLARKAVDVLAQTPADILIVLLLLGYIGTVAESSPTNLLSSPDLLEMGQRWRVLRVPMAWDFNRVHVWASMALVREEFGLDVGLGVGLPFQPSSRTQTSTHMQTVHKILGLPTACIWHLAAIVREYNHDHNPLKQIPTHLYDDQMTGLTSGTSDNGIIGTNSKETINWVPLDIQVFELACRMEMIGQRIYGLAEVGRVVGSIGLGVEVEVAAGQDANMRGIGPGMGGEEEGKESPFIFRELDPSVKLKMKSKVPVAAESSRAGEKRKRAASDDASMRIIRSGSDVGAGKGQHQGDSQEYEHSGGSISEVGGHSQVVDDCELFIQAAVEVPDL